MVARVAMYALSAAVVFLVLCASSCSQDAFDQHVYMERWERLPGGRGPFFAIRRRPSRLTCTQAPCCFPVLYYCCIHPTH